MGDLVAKDEEAKRLEDTPSKRNEQTMAELQNLVDVPMADDQLLEAFRKRANQVRAGKTVEERKDELRASIRPWMDAGRGYRGPKRPGLYLADGTRNPARPARGAPSGPPPVTIPVSPGVTATGTGTASADTGKQAAGPEKGQKGTKAPPTTSKGTKSSAGIGISSTIGKGNKSSTGTGTSSSTGTKAPPPPPPPADKGHAGKDLLPGKRKDASSGVRKSSSKDKQPSPLSNPPIRPEDVEEVINDTPIGTDRAGWRLRDDLFEAQVMDAAGIEFFRGGEKFDALPQLESTIDYNTENWE